MKLNKLLFESFLFLEFVFVIITNLHEAKELKNDRRNIFKISWDYFRSFKQKHILNKDSYGNIILILRFP